MVEPEFELVDKEGTSDVYAGSVDTTGVSVPPSAVNDIEEIWISCPDGQAPQTVLEYSFDGLIWFRLRPGGERYREPRKGLKQIEIRAAGQNILTAKYEIYVNRGQPE